jgi:hypothetical protein
MLKSVLNQALREITVPDVKLVQTTRDDLVVCEYKKPTLPNVKDAAPVIKTLIGLYNTLIQCITDHCIKLNFNNVYFKVGDNYYCFYDRLIVLTEAQSNELTRENIFEFLNKKRKFAFFSHFHIDCSPIKCEEKDEEMDDNAAQVKHIDNPEREIQVQGIESQIDKMNVLIKVLERCINHKVYVYYCKPNHVDEELLQPSSESRETSGLIPKTCLNLVIDINIDVNETVSQEQKLLVWEQRNPRNATDPDMASDRDRSTQLKGPKARSANPAQSQHMKLHIQLHMIKLRIYRQFIFQQNHLLASSPRAEFYKTIIQQLIDEVESSAEEKDNLERELVEHIRMLNTLEQNIRNMGGQRAIRKMLFAFALETNNDELKRIVRVEPLIGVVDMLGLDRQSKFFARVLNRELQFVNLNHSLHEGIQNEMVVRPLATVASSAAPKRPAAPSITPAAVGPKPPPKPPPKLPALPALPAPPVSPPPPAPVSPPPPAPASPPAPVSPALPAPPPPVLPQPLKLSTLLSRSATPPPSLPSWPGLSELFGPNKRKSPTEATVIEENAAQANVEEENDAQTRYDEEKRADDADKRSAEEKRALFKALQRNQEEKRPLPHENDKEPKAAEKPRGKQKDKKKNSASLKETIRKGVLDKITAKYRNTYVEEQTKSQQTDAKHILEQQRAQQTEEAEQRRLAAERQALEAERQALEAERQQLLAAQRAQEKQNLVRKNPTPTSLFNRPDRDFYRSVHKKPALNDP